MTNVPSVNNINPNYSAVKIRINEPKTIIPEGMETNLNNGTYNAINVEVNRPTVEVIPKSIYEYAPANQLVTADMAVINPMAKMPVIPVAYNLVTNKTLIAADINVAKPQAELEQAPLVEEIVVVGEILESSEEPVDEQVAIIEDTAVEETIAEDEVASPVPAPNLTTVEAEKEAAAVNFQGISFRGTETTPQIEVEKVLANLNNKDYDTQALQMEEIARAVMENPEKALDYISTEVFSSLIDIVEKDTSNLEAPSDKVIETRKKIIINQIVKEQEAKNTEKTEKKELPYNITEEDLKLAATLTDLEMAERNKEYALYTMTLLSKLYADEVERLTGNVVPLTDLPGASTVVDTLRYNQNPGNKVAAIDALRYIARPEYNEELKSILTLATRDASPYVAQNAAAALLAINGEA